jgi:hypothetical protein
VSRNPALDAEKIRIIKGQSSAAGGRFRETNPHRTGGSPHAAGVLRRGGNEFHPVPADSRHGGRNHRQQVGLGPAGKSRAHENTSSIVFRPRISAPRRKRTSESSASGCSFRMRPLPAAERLPTDPRPAPVSGRASYASSFQQWRKDLGACASRDEAKAIDAREWRPDGGDGRT